MLNSRAVLLNHIWMRWYVICDFYPHKNRKKDTWCPVCFQSVCVWGFVHVCACMTVIKWALSSVLLWKWTWHYSSIRTTTSHPHLCPHLVFGSCLRLSFCHARFYTFPAHFIFYFLSFVLIPRSFNFLKCWNFHLPSCLSFISFNFLNMVFVPCFFL